ncbi:MAG: UPF0149 family protein [Pseudomonadota bacterium]
MSILDEHPTDSDSHQFDEIANALLDQGDMVSPSELHGCLCGLLGGGLKGDTAAMVAAMEATIGISLHGSLVDAVSQLYTAILSALGDGDLDFNPLLPDDAFELGQRVDAMASWCRGFLGGYAQARVSAEATGDAVAPDSAEVLRDFAAIAQANSEGEEGESVEDIERDFEELFEYLRVAAMNVMLDAGIEAAGAELGSE